MMYLLPTGYTFIYLFVYFIFADLEAELLNGAINPNMTLASNPIDPSIVKQEQLASDPCLPINLSTSGARLARTHPQSQTILKQPAIILATTSSAGTSPQAVTTAQSVLSGDHYLVPKFIKVEAKEDASNSSSPEHNRKCCGD